MVDPNSSDYLGNTELLIRYPWTDNCSSLSKLLSALLDSPATTDIVCATATVYKVSLIADVH